MGNSPSSEENVPSVPTKPRTLHELISSGRYARLPKPNGGVVHMLGIIPGASTSEDEVRLLINKVRPDLVYIDLPSEDVEELRGQLSRSINGKPPLPGPDFPKFKYDRSRGIFASLMKVQNEGDKEVALLMGLDMDRSYRAALDAVVRQKIPVLTYPYKYSERYQEGVNALVRTIDTHLTVMGKDGPMSDENVVELNTLQGISKPLFTARVGLKPSNPYLTTEDVKSIRNHCQAGIDREALAATSQNCDGEEPLNAAALSTDATVMEQAVQITSMVDTAHRQAKAVNYHLQSSAGENVVAIVNLSRVASYNRLWDSAAQPEEMYPRATMTDKIIQKSVIGVPLAAVGYGYYRGVRRFPKTMAGLTVVFGILAASKWWEVTHRNYLFAGGAVRAALARPIPPVGANLRQAAAAAAAASRPPVEQAQSEIPNEAR